MIEFSVDTLHCLQQQQQQQQSEANSCTLVTFLKKWLRIQKRDSVEQAALDYLAMKWVHNDR